MDARGFDAGGFKVAMREQWNFSAQGWNSEGPKVRGWLAAATNAMIEMADIRPSMRALDVALAVGTAHYGAEPWLKRSTNRR